MTSGEQVRPSWERGAESWKGGEEGLSAVREEMTRKAQGNRNWVSVEQTLETFKVERHRPPPLPSSLPWRCCLQQAGTLEPRAARAASPLPEGSCSLAQVRTRSWHKAETPGTQSHLPDHRCDPAQQRARTGPARGRHLTSTPLPCVASTSALPNP